MMRTLLVILVFSLSLILLNASLVEDPCCRGNNSGKTIGSRGLDLVKEFEGLRLKAYKDPVGIWTIGYGHTKGVYEGQVITKEKAEVFLKNDLKDSENYVKEYIEVRLSQSQFDALVSWTFNLGPGNLKRSTMLKRLNECNLNAVPCEMMRWVYAGGKVLRGLERRRKAEGELFNGGLFTCPSSNVNDSDKTMGDRGLDLVKEFEGLRLEAYKDPVGIWTIGYGHTKGVVEGQVITKEKAEVFLKNDLKDSENYVKEYIKIRLTQSQFDALVSWTFNLGPGNLKRSTMLKRLNECNPDAVPCEMMRWVYAGGKVLRGLERRRKAEGELFNGGPFTC